VAVALAADPASRPLVEWSAAQVWALCASNERVHVETRIAMGEVSTDPSPRTGLMSHHVSRHLPRHTRQLRALRAQR
jgi:hypothetical protein